MRNKSRKIIYFTRSNAALAVLLAVLAASAVAPWLVREKSEEALVVEDTKPVRRAIDGLLVAEGGQNPPLAGVMIENMVEAQPISGIADARLVFEAVTEANITRFLGYFVLKNTTPNPSSKRRGNESLSPPFQGGDQGVVAAEMPINAEVEIGPVRSARPYYLDFAAEFDTLFTHVGSSPAAYELLRKTGVEGVQDLDQWYKPQYFYFKNGKPRPHHIYTTTELLGEAYEKLAISSPPSAFSAWIYKSDAPPDLRGDVSEIRVQYQEPYDVRWVYDKFDNQYKRFQWARPNFSTEKVSGGQGGVHTTADGKEIIAKNIAVAFQKMKILDEVGRKEFQTAGEGKGLLFQDGRVVVGTWRKMSARERMRWYDAQGQEAEFNAGVTWVEMVPEEYEVRY